MKKGNQWLRDTILTGLRKYDTMDADEILSHFKNVLQNLTKCEMVFGDKNEGKK